MKYSFYDHYEDVKSCLFKLIHGNFSMESLEMRITMIAYERWLNNRELMSIENEEK